MNFIKKIKNYFEHKYILRTFKKVSYDIRQPRCEFYELIEKYDKKVKFYDRIFTYAILTVVCEFEIGTDLDILKKVYDKDSEYMKSIVDCYDDSKCIEIIQLKTKRAFVIYRHKKIKTYSNTKQEFNAECFSEYNFGLALKAVTCLIENNEIFIDNYCKSYMSLSFTKESIELGFNYLIDSIMFDENCSIYENKKQKNELEGLHMHMLLTYVKNDYEEIPKDKFKQIKFCSERKVDLGQNEIEITSLIKWRNKKQWLYFANAYGTDDDLGKLCLEKSNQSN
ncbi:hypothetical protein [Confluentibacter flavum]|uniref:Uncharacterized protein n=1 Tax=Confluentibacter flavum TaxID=1909700 RepID=A0A2N3HKT0_9FLAO|nr:hypothetical protein [Confluentibacter flavum]PKQ45541.1 hypothetical protein CSW08_07505 [Confluentibacter flavum]